MKDLISVLSVFLIVFTITLLPKVDNSQEYITQELTLPVPSSKVDNTYKYTAIIRTRYNLSEDLAYKIVKTVYKYSDDYTFPSASTVLAVIATESRFRPNVISSVGAKGLMQVREVFHGPVPTIETNIRTGIEVLKKYRTRTQTDTQALEAYNVGITALLRGTRQNPRYVSSVITHKRIFV